MAGSIPSIDARVTRATQRCGRQRWANYRRATTGLLLPSASRDASATPRALASNGMPRARQCRTPAWRQPSRSLSTFSLCSRSAHGCSNGDVSIVLADGQLEEVIGIYTQGQGRDGCNGPGFSSVHSGNRTTGARAFCCAPAQEEGADEMAPSAATLRPSPSDRQMGPHAFAALVTVEARPGDDKADIPSGPPQRNLARAQV
jgi:hypothetical protein